MLDLKWDGPHTIWSCGYDTCLRRWDLRTGKSEQNFYDPHASVLYCLEYDYCNTVMTGAQSYGRVILWDTRQPRSVQVSNFITIFFAITFLFSNKVRQKSTLISSNIYSKI